MIDSARGRERKRETSRLVHVLPVPSIHVMIIYCMQSQKPTLPISAFEMRKKKLAGNGCSEIYVQRKPSSSKQLSIHASIINVQSQRARSRRNENQHTVSKGIPSHPIPFHFHLGECSANLSTPTRPLRPQDQPKSHHQNASKRSDCFCTNCTQSSSSSHFSSSSDRNRAILTISSSA